MEKSKSTTGKKMNKKNCKIEMNCKNKRNKRNYQIKMSYMTKEKKRSWKTCRELQE